MLMTTLSFVVFQ